MGFIDEIKSRARRNKKTIVLPETEDVRIIKAAARIMEEGIANLILVGNREEVLQDAKNYGYNLGEAKIIDPKKFERMDEYVNTLVELRKNKGMTPEKARKLLTTDYLHFGVMCVKMEDADGMVAGACHATADVLRPSLQILKTAPGTELVSGLFVMVVPDCDLGANGTFIFADAGLNQNPTAQELAIIAGSSAKSFRLLVQEEPIVAMISHSTKGSASHPDVDKVVEATRIAKEKYPKVKLDGEFQVDAAIVPSVGSFKAPGNDVAGHANVLVFPNLDAGNNGYKLVQRLAKAEAYGPLTQGISRPVNDLSRGCSASDIVGVVAITAVQAGANVVEKKNVSAEEKALQMVKRDASGRYIG
ncbi:MAG: phosphate acetyltransferase [Lachnospiraceae bacterium]|nr:phosphate acetyltransferase [Lachnospiraceae bacterium]MBQ5561686.1 phosphate acetyltransferase [Lachnospiraceae bacterium]